MLSADLVREKAIELGFDLVGFAPAGPTPGARAFLDWLSAGHVGEMSYLAREPHKRADPRHVLPSARTVILVGLSYETQAVPFNVLQDPSRGRIARYAWGLDYHDVMTPKLRELGEFISRESRAYVDTGPVLERAWAEACGLGFIGKNTCLINRERGSFLFLGAVLVAEEIGDWGLEIVPIQSPIPNLQSPSISRKSLCGCGNCTRCLTACPTQAFPQPGVLDARRCISYLTIELKGSIPIELRPHLGNWIFGCDICQDVCPYVRRYSVPTRNRLGQSFFPIDVERAAPKLSDVLRLDRAAFNIRYKGTPIARAKRRGLLRNACVAAANWGSDEVVPVLRSLLNDEEPLVREHAEWALESIQVS
jgi:epoxyqueuosine reductase